MNRCVGVLILVALCAPLWAAPLEDVTFAGVRLRDNPEGLVVGGVRPGPFAPGTPEQALLRRNDLIVSVNGKPVDAAGFERVVGASKPGDELVIELRRGKPAEPFAPLPIGDPAGELMRVSAKLASAETWTGTLGRGEARAEAARIEQMSAIAPRVRALAEQTGTWSDGPEGMQLESLLKYLGSAQRRTRDSFGMPIIERCFADPLAMDAVEKPLCGAVRELIQRPDQRSIERFVQAIFPISEQGGKAPSEQEAVRLARHLRDAVSIEGPDSKELIATVRAAPAGVSRYVADAKQWRSVEDWNERLRYGAATSPCSELPAKLRESTTGDILYYEKLKNGRYAVAGADGVNSYNMDLIEIVYDLGGNDVYWFGSTDRAGCTNHLITDISGNDEYISESDFRGPGVAINGFSFIDDRQGDDIYRSTGTCSLACGLFGVGVIIDRGGDDRYESTGPGSGWSIGAGIDGAGMIIDLAGDDCYTGEKLTEGAAGPYGFGAIIDGAGNDRYVANGPSFPSAYDTPGTFLAMSQGFAMGIREYASGGIGAIYDFGGNDEYTAGEFSQGCGYFLALGILHDAEGNDVYSGSRYSQAAAAHLGVGLLIDEAGNDTYRAKTAASQSGAWDQSVTMLVDRAGDDVYEADDLCQGAAAQQALSLFFDEGGVNRFTGTGPSIQGMSGPNEYHFNADKLMSFSLFSGTGESSCGRTGVMRTGALDGGAIGKSRAWGVFCNPAAAFAR